LARLIRFHIVRLEYVNQQFLFSIAWYTTFILTG
jgi:hypothetical protein